MPFKIAFFMWKVWKGRIQMDDFFKRLGYCLPSRCWCCSEPAKETMSHVFFKSFVAYTVWYYFMVNAGISINGMSLQQAMAKCWIVQVVPRLKPIFQALPSIILWELWKRRNCQKHGEMVTISRIIYQISTSLQSLVKIRKPSI